MSNNHTFRTAQEPQPDKDRKLAQLIALVEQSELSSIKGVVSGVVRVINDPHSNVKELKELIQVDPPLTAKVLRVANSAYYASPRKISEIDQAIIWIGFDALKEIILTQKVSEIFDNDTLLEGYSRELLWKHSLAVALLVKMIYRREFGEKGDNAYAAGLVHDIGIIVEDQMQHEDFLKVLSESKTGQQQIAETESSILGYDHTDVGRALTLHWNFPQDMGTSIGYHHAPDTNDPKYARLAKTLFIADCLAFEHDYGFGEPRLPGKLVFERYADYLKLSPYALKSIVLRMRDDLARIEDKGIFSK